MKPKPIEINNKSTLSEQTRDILKGARREIIGGYPRPAPIGSIEEIIAYLSQADDIDCLLCGRRMKSLSTHLARIHRISGDEYRRMYGLPYQRGLTCAEMTSKLQSVRARDSQKVISDRISRLTSKDVQAQKNQVHARTSDLKAMHSRLNAVIATKINTESKVTRREIEKIVQAVEAGEMLYPYLKRTRLLSASYFKAVLINHPDLHQRYKAVAGEAKREHLKSNNPAKRRELK